MSLYHIDGFLFPQRIRISQKYIVFSLCILVWFCVFLWKNALMSNGDDKTVGVIFALLITIVTAHFFRTGYNAVQVLNISYSCFGDRIIVKGINLEYVYDLQEGYHISKLDLPFYFGKTRFDIGFLVITIGSKCHVINLRNSSINTILDNLKTGILILPYDERIKNWLLRESNQQSIPKYPSSMFSEYHITD